MTGAVLAGMVCGLGLWLVARIVVPFRVPLAVALARVDAATSGAPATSAGPAVSVWGSGRVARRVATLEWLLGERVAARLPGRGVLGARLGADLAVLGVDEHGYLTRKLLLAAGALVVAPALAVPAAAAAGLPWLAGAWVAVLVALFVFVAPDLRVKAAAGRRRRDFTAAVAAYLDLVAMRAASGSGVAEALRDAAGVGAGPAFARIRGALDDARVAGIPPARGLAALGVELDVPELRQLAAQLQLVDASGAQAEASLRAKAEALRARQLADAHGGANARSQTMLVGQVLLGLGFLLFMGYPGVAAILSM